MYKILIAEDDLELQDLLKFTFESVGGYEIYQAFDGKEALTKVKEILPDVVVLDVLMPEINGFEVVEELRNYPETCLIPIIMLTSLSQTKDKLTALKLGADEYLVKPIDPYELIARVESLLKKYHDNVNPLTHLPGVNIFENQINLLLNSSKSFHLIFLNINGFKPYNLKYSFEQGDNLLKLFSGILRATLTNFGSKKDCLYHLQADRFAIITYLDELGELIDRIMMLFRELLKKIYPQETLQLGYDTYLLSDGTELKVDLITISVVIIKVLKNKFNHYGEILTYSEELLGLAKQKSKETKSSTVIWG